MLLPGRILENVTECSIKAKGKFTRAIIKIGSVTQMKLALSVMNSQL